MKVNSTLAMRNRAEIEGAMKRQGIKAIVNPIAIK